MTRPQTASDDEIIQAAYVVLTWRGHECFTLSEVAEQVGLSRAAITLRFKSALALKRRVLEQRVARFITLVDALPKSPSGDNLVEIAAFIGRELGQQDSHFTFLNIYSGNMKLKDLAEIEARRSDAIFAAIKCCMPPSPLTTEQAAFAFLTHLLGSLVVLQSVADSDRVRFLIERAHRWLTLAGIPYSEVYDGVWLNSPAPPIVPAPRAARARRLRRWP